MLKRIKRLIEDPSRLKRAIQRRMRGVISSGSRAVTRKVHFNGLDVFRKDYTATADAKACFQNELAARKIFAGKPWIIPIHKQGDNWMQLPLLPENARLDIAVKSMDKETRRKAIGQALSILLDIHCAGYLHGDFHARNIFWLEGQVLVGDFEKLTQYPDGRIPPFMQSYDLTGRADNVNLTGRADAPPMYYSATDFEFSLERVSHIPLKEGLTILNECIKDELRNVTLEFQTVNHRHRIRSERIYSSFSLPHLKVLPDEAQRDSAKRLARFGVNELNMSGASVLDLGCNTGGNIFESQKFLPARCRGVEFDMEKVTTATRIAVLNGLDNVVFTQGNVDYLSLNDVNGPYDIVFCLALIGHVKYPERLYELLGKVTSKTLYFEGNLMNIDWKNTEKNLIKAGFFEVEYLGVCDDDCLEDNNKRPVFIAKK